MFWLFLLILCRSTACERKTYAGRREDRFPSSGLAGAGFAGNGLAGRRYHKEKEPLDAPVIYEASDSIVFTKEGYAHLYGEGKVNYQNIELTSAVITMNMDSSTVYATGVTDTAGVETGSPIFKDGETPYESKIMRYNFKTKKGFINSIVTQQGEGYVTSEEGKKGANDEIYMRHGKYTTCDNHEHPHFI